MSETYVQFAPVPYSAVRMDVPPVFDEDGMDFEATANNLAEAWTALMGAFDGVLAVVGVPEGAAPVANCRPAAAQPASRGTGTGVWCKEHRAELIQSTFAMSKKNEYDNFYHPLAQPGADGQKNCNLWFRQTVDVTGESNEGQPLPPSVKQPPVEAEPAGRPDGDPGPSEPQF